MALSGRVLNILSQDFMVHKVRCAWWPCIELETHQGRGNIIRETVVAWSIQLIFRSMTSITNNKLKRDEKYSPRRSMLEDLLLIRVILAST